MATTTNFGWETPDDTDLVKDGAAAIRTLGSAIDTSLVDLKGGTTGQILSKATGTDMDFTWITNDVGDITAVSAGTGITGGGTTGAITITNDMATTITASGDIVVGTGSGTYDNLPIGTTGQVLTADTTVSPYKVKWAAPAGGATFVGCSLYDTNLTQSIANSTNVALTWNSEYFDTDGFHDTSSNTSRITIPTGKGGKYLLTGATHYSTGSTGYRAIKFKKNGGDFFDINYGAAGAYTGLPITAIVELSVGDYVELITVQNSGGSLDAYKYTATSYGWFAAQYLGA